MLAHLGGILGSGKIGGGVQPEVSACAVRTPRTCGKVFQKQNELREDRKLEPEVTTRKANVSPREMVGPPPFPQQEHWGSGLLTGAQRQGVSGKREGPGSRHMTHSKRH